MQVDGPEIDYESLSRASQRRATYGLLFLMGLSFVAACAFVLLIGG